MATFPLPAGMIATGNGPNQIPVRDNESKIPGVPVVYHRTMTDEVASSLREQNASGFLRGGRLRGTLEVTPLARDHVYFDPMAPAEVLVDGFRVNLGAAEVAIELPVAPLTGTRDDLVFLEFWFIRSLGGGRSLEWRFRVQSGVDFATNPDGLGDPIVKARGAGPVPTAVAFAKTNPLFPNFDRDPGIYIAALPAGENDPLSEPGTDDNPYLLVYAIPVARIRRLNQDTYNPATNPNGATSYDEDGVSARPDGLWHDAIDVDYQIVDLRYHVGRLEPVEELMRRSLLAFLKNQLKAQGIKQQITTLLGTDYFRGHIGSRAAVDRLVVTTNMVRYSHFRSDSNLDGVADGWSAYATGFTTGTRALTAGGQQITRTSTDNSNHWGVTAPIAGFNAKQLYVRFGATPAASDSLTRLVVAGYDGATEVFNVEMTGLSTDLNTLHEKAQAVDLENWHDSLDIKVYLVGGAADVQLRYVDIRPDTRTTPVMEVTDGSVFTVPLGPTLTAAGATFDDTSVDVYDTLTGLTVSGTSDILVGGDLEFRPSIIEATRDLRIAVDVVYPAGGGFAQLFDSVTRTWDAQGFVSPISRSLTSGPVSAQQLGQVLAVGDSVTAYNPLQSNRGTVVTLRVQGNGTGTYVIPATAYGRNVLMPVAVRVASLAVGLASAVRATNGTWTIVLASGQTVISTDTFEVDVAVDAPVLVWDKDIVGVETVACSMLIKTEMLAADTEVVIPAPGLVRGYGLNLVTNPVIVNGTASPLSVAIVFVATDVPVVKLTFPTPLSAGDVVELLALVDYDMHEGSGLRMSYPTSIAPEVSLPGSTPLRLLTNVLVLTHTKGSGGADVVGDFGVAPFTPTHVLVGDEIGYAGDSADTTVLYDMPVKRNKLLEAPVQAGRDLQVSHLADASLLLEASNLGQTVPHVIVGAALVDVGGRELLMVLSETRSDNKVKLTNAAEASFYEPDGRPIGVNRAG